MVFYLQKIPEISVGNFCGCGTKFGLKPKDWNWCKLYEKVNGTQISIPFPFEKFRFSRKFYSGQNQNVVFHLQPNGSLYFRAFFLKGKQPQSSLRSSHLLRPLIPGEQDCDDFKTKDDKNVKF